MQRFCVSHLSHPDLARGLASRIAQDRVHSAELLAYLAEFDARKLYRDAAYPSMHAYCVGELRLSEDATEKRITVARLSARFPAILELISDGRLHLSGAVLLAPHLRDETADDLIAAAMNQTKAEIERIIAERYPRPNDSSGSLELGTNSQGATKPEPAPGRVGGESESTMKRGDEGGEPAPGRVRSDAGADSAASSQPRHRARITPIGPGLHELRATIGDAELEQLRHAQSLLSHCVRPGDVTEVLRRALDALVANLEKRKFAAASKPRPARPGVRTARTIPASVRRAVWERDGGRCAFVSDSGRRCEARDHLEFDHIRGVAQGGAATVDNVRLLCRPHNQLEAERTYGAEFMRQKRIEASESRRARRTKRAGDTRAAKATTVDPDDRKRSADEVVPWLRSLGLSSADASRAAQSAGATPDATVESRVRSALAFHGTTRMRRQRHSGEAASVAVRADASCGP